MSFDYSTPFTRIGKSVKAINLLLTFQGSTLPGYYDAVLDQYEGRRDLVTPIQQASTSNAGTVAGWISTIKSVVDKTLGDLQGSLNANSSSPSTILPLLATQMTADSQTVLKNGISAPSITATSGNVGNGQLIASINTAAGIPDEGIIDETLKMTCAADSFTGATAAAEPFRIVGQPTSSPSTSSPLGNGSGATVSVADAGANILLNPGFETFTVSNTPDSWTMGTGAVASTTILQELTNFRRGASALQCKGDGSTATVILSQTLASGRVAPSTVYAAAVWLRKAGTVTSGSTFAVTIKGTSFSTATLFSADPTSLTTSYVAHYVFFASAAPPSDLRISIDWTSANSAGSSAQVLVDDVVIVPAANFGGVNYALLAGTTNYRKGDSIGVVTASNSAGVFQSFFTRFYDFALPSATSGSETISDSLAT